ncbi:SDR family oxidoreductase [Sphingomonas jaspsi]|uniref:SDR family oxidoreductase n=1 Tax=Sphingomonas jaspsi TaxID=392409 RepID=UPI0004AFCECE|nr:SDR family oxidoreductase [Sphingomonas jaspsi]
MENRVAIVTGGAKRVGRQIVEALLADGWHVFAHCHNADDDVPASAGKVAADLSDPAIGRILFDAAAATGPVGLLVNNAAKFGDDRLGAADADEFDSHMAVNARAPMLLIDELARRHGSGEALVVNILDAKLAAPNPDFLSYTLSKYALAGLTEIAARALAGKGIRVNAVAPALMLPSGEQDEANFEKVHRHNPLKVGVEVADVVAAIRYLIDSRVMTGQTLALDGGQRFMALDRDVQFLETK